MNLSGGRDFGVGLALGRYNLRVHAFQSFAQVQQQIAQGDQEAASGVGRAAWTIKQSLPNRAFLFRLAVVSVNRRLYNIVNVRCVGWLKQLPFAPDFRSR
jgi:hypothetical protein